MSPDDGIITPHNLQEPLDRLLTLTRFPDQWAKSKKEVRCSLRSLANQIREKKAASKGELPFLKMATFGDTKTAKGCLRHDANVLKVLGIEGDHDTGQMTPEEARDRLTKAGIVALIYTTPSHTSAKPRWRVMCPFSAPLPPKDRARHVARLNGVLKGMLAGESFTLSQAFYAGGVTGGAPVQTFLVDGDHIDRRPDLDAGAVGRPGRRGTAAGGTSLDERAALKAITTGESYHPNMVALAGKWATACLPYLDSQQRLLDALHSVPDAKKDDRWAERVAEVPRILAGIYGHRAAERSDGAGEDEEDDWTSDFDWCWAVQHPNGEQPEVEDLLGGYALDQDGVIRAFTDRHATELRFDHHAGAWFRFDGVYWEREETKLAHHFARAVSTELAKRDARAKPLKSVPTWEAVERGARTVREFACTSARWDTEPMLLGTPGGTVDLKTGRLRKALPSDYISKITAVTPINLDSFDPARDCPQWLAFLDSALGGDGEAIRFLQQWGGYTLTGDIREQVLLFIYGPGGSGKSTAINTMMAILKDYAVAVATSTLTAKKYEAHPEEIARLHGPRMAIASETEKGSKWAENRIKEMTGGDLMTARFMRENSFSFRPQFKLTIVGNNAPSLSNVDTAIRRRFMILPFNHPPARRDDTLAERLKAEWSGILSWMIQGCLDWQAHGLVRPAVLNAATDSYFEEQDTFGQWIADCCETGTGMADTTARLFESWQRYAWRAGEEPGTKNKAFPERLQQRGFKPSKNIGATRGRGFMGICLAQAEEDFTDDVI